MKVTMIHLLGNAYVWIISWQFIDVQAFSFKPKWPHRLSNKSFLNTLSMHQSLPVDVEEVGSVEWLEDQWQVE